jgi:hypothetical protein
MNKSYRKTFLTLMLGGLGLFSCSSDTGDQATETVSCPPGAEASVAEKLDTLNIIIETSGSMAGFMPTRGGTQTEFQREVDNLLANAESMEGSGIRTLRYFSARDRLYKEVYSRFNQMLRNGLRKVGASTPLPNLLDEISGKYTGNGQVSLFISDFIYAPPNQRNRDFIANDIRRALNSGTTENFVVSVFAAQSDFVGTFYPAASERPGGAVRPVPSCCDTPIPYYVWVMGPEEKVRLVNREIMQGNFEEQLHFGFKKQEPAFMVIPGSGRQGEWYPADREGKVIVLDNSRSISREPFSYTIGLRLDALPGQVANAEYLQENLRLEVENGEAHIEQVYSRNEFSASAVINNKDRKLLECFSHFITISVDKVFNRNSDINVALALQNQLPPWVASYATTNDSQIEEVGAKTFALDEILEGAARSARTQDNQFFTVSTTIDLSR